MQKKKYFVDLNSVILFHRNNLSIYLVILYDSDNLKRGMILDFC